MFDSRNQFFRAIVYIIGRHRYVRTPKKDIYVNFLEYKYKYLQWHKQIASLKKYYSV